MDFSAIAIGLGHHMILDSRIKHSYKRFRKSVKLAVIVAYRGSARSEKESPRVYGSWESCISK